jgi:hypothetical protein
MIFGLAVGHDDVVQAEDTVDVGAIDAGLDLVDDPQQRDDVLGYRHHRLAQNRYDYHRRGGREPATR